MIASAERIESDKAGPALDSPQDAESFVVEHRTASTIQVCKIEDIDVFSLMCSMFVDAKVEEIRMTVQNFNLPELVLPTPNYGGWIQKADDLISWIEESIQSKESHDLGFKPNYTWRNDLFEDEPEVLDLHDPTQTFPDGQKPEEQLNYYILDEGNACEFATALISQASQIIIPVLAICNPVSYIKCAMRSTRIVDAKLVAEYEGSISVNDSRACDLQEFQDMHLDQLCVYRYKVVLFDGVEWDAVPAAYFPKVSNRERYPWYVRCFTDLPEPGYKSVVLSMNMIKELYHAKTCSVNIPEDSFRVMNRMFLNNPHNTFTEEALTGDRILECNFEFSCMFCQNSYTPVDKCSPVK